MALNKQFCINYIYNKFIYFNTEGKRIGLITLLSFYLFVDKLLKIFNLINIFFFEIYLVVLKRTVLMF